MAKEQKKKKKQSPKCQWKRMLKWINIQCFAVFKLKTKAKPE